MRILIASLVLVAGLQGTPAVAANGGGGPGAPPATAALVGHR